MSQLTARAAGENRTRMNMLKLLSAASIWRTAMTLVLPLCGVSTWWVALVCLLPGGAVAVLMRFVMHRTHTETLTEAVRACLGKVGVANTKPADGEADHRVIVLFKELGRLCCRIGDGL